MPKSNDERVGRDRSVLPNGSPPSTAPSGPDLDLDVSWLVPPDLDAIDALARLQVVVSRCGGLLRLHGVDGGLAELVDFVGLSDVMPLCRCCTCRARFAGEAEPLPS